MEDVLASLAHFIWPWTQTVESFNTLDDLLRFQVEKL